MFTLVKKFVWTLLFCSVPIIQASESPSKVSSDALIPSIAYLDYGAFLRQLPQVDFSRPALVAIVSRVAQFGNFEFLTSLLDHKADVNEKERLSGETALHAIAGQSNVQKAQQLIYRRADINATDKLGRTPLIIACNTAPLSRPTGNIPIIDVFLSDPTTNLHTVSTISNALCVLATNKNLQSEHLPLIQRMFQLGMDPNGHLLIGKDGTQKGCFSICKIYKDPIAEYKPSDKSVCKSVLLALDAHRATIARTTGEIASATSLNPSLSALTTHYLYTSPDNKELDDALEVYKDVQPAQVPVSPEKAESKRDDEDEDEVMYA